jgi:hypothetical protein
MKTTSAILSIVSAITASSIEQAGLFQEAKLSGFARLLDDSDHNIKHLLIPVPNTNGYLKLLPSSMAVTQWIVL